MRNQNFNRVIVKSGLYFPGFPVFSWSWRQKDAEFFTYFHLISFYRKWRHGIPRPLHSASKYTKITSKVHFQMLYLYWMRFPLAFFLAFNKLVFGFLYQLSFLETIDRKTHENMGCCLKTNWIERQNWNIISHLEHLNPCKFYSFFVYT